ncbi:hypothetical protein GCM10011415_18650 [Salipiger pallidus]|uniref:Thioredoxin domain-containing protein n=1 Tax=Salipiger pallidus TaxID=1775170 RepID=A0A8J2ZJN1_9RHOB|nr:DsbA family protein [Salipiger pallidus]GGG71126.1 hypothetical protein GCM10011415_18650 [Salipiger pallidus]
MLDRRTLLIASGAAAAIALRPRGVWAQEITVEGVLYDPAAPVLGNPEGDVTIVEYFDYQCPYCKAMHPDLMRVARQDGGLRIVLKDWPIFGPVSTRAARLALGAQDLGAYEQVVNTLMATTGRLSNGQLNAAVQQVLAPGRAQAAYRKRRAHWDGLLERNAMQAEAFGFAGTPGVLVDTVVFDGALDHEALTAAVAEVRSPR